MQIYILFEYYYNILDKYYNVILTDGSFTLFLKKKSVFLTPHKKNKKTNWSFLQTIILEKIVFEEVVF